ncbi:MAG: efflux RND transporter periplasmic adaptor subunit [Myxococcota bacterium]
MVYRYIAIVAAAAWLAGCAEADHGHDHAAEGGHAHEEEAGHDDEGGHGHGDEAGHDDHGHGHERPAQVVTQFGERHQLYVEFPALLVGHHSEFAAHFTGLDGWEPVTRGSLAVVLTGPDHPGERWEANAPARAGIFTPAVTPRHAGERRLLLLLETEDGTERFDLGTVRVFEDAAAAAEAHFEEPVGDISFLLETQWKVDFGVTAVREQPLRPSVPANATVRPAADAEARVMAPFGGRIAAPDGGVPQVGRRVEAGEVVAWVVPRLEPGGAANLEAEVRKAEVRVRRAKREVARLRRLAEAGAIPRKRLLDAESDLDVARAEVEQARGRRAQHEGLGSEEGDARGRVAIRSPIAGTVTSRAVVDGAFVTAGEPLLQIVDRERLWLQARVPEADAARVGEPTGLWFRPSDGAEPVAIDLTAEGALVAWPDVVESNTRTVSLLAALGEAGTGLRVGAFLRAHVFSGPARQVPVIPASAVLDDKGVDVVYVVGGGETFERRVVRLGVRDRGLVEVVDGLEPGEHVVSEGAYFVKLAATATGAVGHGHAH